MGTKFITVITDEAMQKICYEGGGWILSPFQFAVSETDVLKNTTVLDERGNVTDEAYEKLTSLTTSDMMADISGANNVWCQLPFSSITKANDTTLNHNVIIPSDYGVKTNKTIKTIYFKYQNNDGEIFLYAVAYAIEDITDEIGVTQSFYFTFSVANRRSIDDVTFTVNYTYPQEISDHNTTEDAHSLLVKRDGSRTITGVLSYSGPRDFSSESGYVLVSKDYVDKLIAKLKADNNLK